MLLYIEGNMWWQQYRYILYIVLDDDGSCYCAEVVWLVLSETSSLCDGHLIISSHPCTSHRRVLMIHGEALNQRMAFCSLPQHDGTFSSSPTSPNTSHILPSNCPPCHPPWRDTDSSHCNVVPHVTAQSITIFRFSSW